MTRDELIEKITNTYDLAEGVNESQMDGLILDIILDAVDAEFDVMEPGASARHTRARDKYKIRAAISKLREL
jgi:hypothetical protein